MPGIERQHFTATRLNQVPRSAITPLPVRTLAVACSRSVSAEVFPEIITVDVSTSISRTWRVDFRRISQKGNGPPWAPPSSFLSKFFPQNFFSVGFKTPPPFFPAHPFPSASFFFRAPPPFGIFSRFFWNGPPPPWRPPRIYMMQQAVLLVVFEEISSFFICQL